LGTLLYYAKCIGAVALVAGVFATDSHSQGAIVFLVLLGPALLGAAEGLKAVRESKRPLPPDDKRPGM
jgi:hypothetical protein